LIKKIDISDFCSRIKDLLHDAPLGAVVLDLDGTICYVNRSACNIAGLGQKDLVGKRFNELQMIGEYYIKKTKHVFSDALMGKNSKAFEISFVNAKGRNVFGMVDYTILREKGSILGIMGLVDNITEKRDLEKYLYDDPERYKTITDLSDEGMIIHDGKKFIDVNDTFLRLFGIEKKDLKEKKVIRFMEGILRNTLKGNFKDDRGIRLKRFDGTRFDAEVKYRNIHSNGRRLWSVLIRDSAFSDSMESRLVKELNKAGSYIDIASFIIVALDLNGRIELINKKGRELLGIREDEEALGMDWFKEFIPPGSKMQVKKVFHDSLKGRISRHRIKGNQVIGRDGSIRDIRWNNKVLKDKDGNIIGTLSCGEDITEKIAIKVQLAEEKARLNAILDNSPDIVAEIGLKGELLFINREEQFAGQKGSKDLNILDLINPDHHKTVNQAIRSVRIGEKPYEATLPAFLKGQKDSWHMSRFNPIRSGGHISSLIVHITEVTEKKAYEEKLRYMSFHDSLTGMYNRMYFEEELKRLNTQRNLPLSVITGDVNSLKIVNDTFGHRSGDTLLVEVSKVLKRCCRTGDIIARWGGDEFSILLPCTPQGSAEAIAERVGRECAGIKDFEFPISISMGVASKAENEVDINRVLMDAEDSMYGRKLLERKSIVNSVIASLTRALWEKSDETERHSQRLQALSEDMGLKMGLSRRERDKLALLSLLHDIGKLTVPREILLKKEKLSQDDWREIKKHPETGHNICGSSPLLAHISEEVLCHHEWFDGNGYPRGIKGDDIPLLARVLHIADAYDVMINGRHYKKPLKKKAAFDEIKRCSGTQFDPDIASLFLEIAGYNKAKRKKYYYSRA
jgi:diguanylate cyclase (GGDEF)-like protein/PAS domain S-box-containing protein